jgi:hypothetical protein
MDPAEAELVCKTISYEAKLAKLEGRLALS